MKRSPLVPWLVPLVALGLCAMRPHSARAQENGTVILRGGWLFDAVGNARVRNPGIVVRGGLILKVAAPTDQELAGAQVVALADSETILPGFIDVHGHYSMNLLGRRRDETGLYSVVYLA